MNNTMEIQVKILAKSTLNVRKTVSVSADEELKASILAHGLMQNLVVTEGKKGKYLVIAGGRRLEALKALQAEGKLPADHAVPCQIASEENAEEMSLAENVVRLAMHPADQFMAFAELIEKGQTLEQVAQRFGVAKRTVEGRMKLARVAPELIQAYREEKLSLEALMAFTVTDDHQKQIAAYEDLSDWDLKRPDSIRDALTEEMVESNSKLAAFVGMETYQKAGGVTRTDLFGQDIYLENPELLDVLVDEKLKLVEQELTAEGWGWVQVDLERDWKATQGCSRLRAETMDAPEELLAELKKLEAEQLAVGEQLDATEDDDEIDRLNDRVSELEDLLDEVADKLAAYAKFSPDQMATAGCYAYIGHNGNLEIEKGFVRRDDARKSAKAANSDSDDEQPEEKPKGLSQSLIEDLKAYRLGVAQAQIAKHPAIAFDLLVFKAAMGVFALRPGLDGPDIRFNQNYGSNSSKDARDFIREQMEQVRATLPAAWRGNSGSDVSEAVMFIAFQALPNDRKHAILAYCVAATLQPKLASDDPDDLTAYDVALSQTGANVAEYWRPTKDNFLNRVTKDHLLDIGKELIGNERGEQWASRAANAKKNDVASELHKAFADPESYGGSQEQIDRVKNWLPKGMAFGEAPEPKPAKAKKSKKAA